MVSDDVYVFLSKVYPLAFLEFVEDQDGSKRREGPRNEAEELRNHEQWKVKVYVVPHEPIFKSSFAETT